MTSASLLRLDLACRGGAAAVLLMIAIVALRDYRTLSARFGAALAISGAAYAIVTSPGVEPGWWNLALSLIASGGPVAFWLWARATFDDDFELKPWHLVLWIGLVALRLFSIESSARDPQLAVAADRSLTVLNLVLASLAAAQTVATWRNDLVAGRRRLRVVVLIGTFAFIAADAVAGMAMTGTAGPAGVSGNAGRAIGLVLLSMAAGWGVFRAAASASGAAAPIAVSAAPAAHPQPDHPRQESVNPVLLRRIERLMSEERVYRREGLTIGALAAMLHLPEYRLRQIINEGLGYRNFNAFLNRYRLDEAKAALADITQSEVPVLTIAMDAGFQSIGPFNRAFKSDTGMTPTEFRRAAIRPDRSIR